MQIIETNWLEEEKERINNIPIKFRTEYEKGILFVCEKVLNTKRKPFVYIKDNEKITRKSKYFNKEVEKLNKILDICIKEFGITKEELLLVSRKKEIIYPRHLAIYACKLGTSLGSRDIGREIRNLDHSTVLNAIKAAKDIIDTDSYYSEIFYKILEKAKCVQ